MRHRVQKHSLGLKSDHRVALLANMASSLIEHGRIKTTLAKAKALRPFTEKIITLAKKAKDAEKKDALHFRRLAIARLRNVAMVHKLFDQRVDEFMDRLGGYTRIYKLGMRRGDAAEMALIELIDAEDKGYEKPKRKPVAKKVKEVKSGALEAKKSPEDQKPKIEEPIEAVVTQSDENGEKSQIEKPEKPDSVQDSEDAKPDK